MENLLNEVNLENNENKSIIKKLQDEVDASHVNQAKSEQHAKELNLIANQCKLKVRMQEKEVDRMRTLNDFYSEQL